MDVLYNEWEIKKRLEGKTPDIAGEGESQQDSAASEQNLEQEA
jgi:hypothetical protein